MQKITIKFIMVLLCCMLPIAWARAVNNSVSDGHNSVPTKVAHVQCDPKGNTIQMTLDGHFLSVVFLENLGLVTIELETATGGEVEATQSYTPNGVNFYIPTSGSYIIYFTLENGDVYYGEFEVTAQWQGPDEVVIDYIKVYQLVSDCETDLNIQNASGFLLYTQGVKHSITIGSANGITVPSNINLTMRAEDSITITNVGEFTLPLGAELTLMVHPCVEY